MPPAYEFWNFGLILLQLKLHQHLRYVFDSSWPRVKKYMNCIYAEPQSQGERPGPGCSCPKINCAVKNTGYSRTHTQETPWMTVTEGKGTLKIPRGGWVMPLRIKVMAANQRPASCSDGQNLSARPGKSCSSDCSAFEPGMWNLSRGFYPAHSHFALCRGGGQAGWAFISSHTRLVFPDRRTLNEKHMRQWSTRKRGKQTGQAGGTGNSAKPICEVLAVPGSPGLYTRGRDAAQSRWQRPGNRHC